MLNSLRRIQQASRLCLIVASAILIFHVGFASCGAASETQTGTLCEGTAWSTPWCIVDSGQPGPTVLITGGIHGNEPAGYRAALQIQHWPIVKGKLVVLPQINRSGLAANMRWAPEFRNDNDQRDLNRNFPAADRATAITPLCDEVWHFVCEQRPDWAFDLHEGFDFHCQNPKSVGSSVISFPENSEFAERLCQSVNFEVAAGRKFDLLAGSGPVSGSLARACGEQLHARSFILETTFKGQPVSQRTRQHRLMMSCALLEIGIIDSDCVDVLVPRAAPAKTSVAIFDGPGTSEAGVVAVLDSHPDIFVAHVGPGDIRAAVLGQFDVVLFPGGSGGQQGRAIGSRGREILRQYVRQGGGVVGICAGAYLCSSHYDWALHLMNATVYNTMIEIPGVGRKSMWYRGHSTEVDVEVVGPGSDILGVHGVHSIRYHNGPILSPGNDPDSPPFVVLAVFRSENHLYDVQKDTMVNTPAVVSTQFGTGRVLAFSPHFESTDGYRQVIVRGIQYVRRAGSHAE